MTTKTEQHNALCAICGGTLRVTTITHEERRGDNLYLFQNVPAKVCDASSLYVRFLPQLPQKKNP